MHKKDVCVLHTDCMFLYIYSQTGEENVIITIKNSWPKEDPGLEMGSNGT